MQKYKVFLNEKRIVFASPPNITFSKTIQHVDLNTSAEAVLEWLKNFVKSEQSETIFEHDDCEGVLKNFKSAFLIVDAAGGVVERNGKLLFIFRNGKWDLPKGKIEEGEYQDSAALREVAEECGISGHSIRAQLPSTYHIYQSPYKESKGKWIFKETFWYEMDYSGLENGSPQQEEGIKAVRWFAKSELDEVLENTYENLKGMIESYRG